MNADAPVGVFDSGLGGLSVLRELRTVLPREDFIYVADSGHCPYGEKPVDAILARADTMTQTLIALGAKLVVVACNTATVVAVDRLRRHYPIPFVGMEPAVKPAVSATRSGVIGVLSTPVTADGERLQRLIRQYAQGVRVLTRACPGLVEQVEAGALDTSLTHKLIARYTAPLLAAGADVLVLGCTHYPFLRLAIAGVVGAEVRLIDTGAAVARRTAAVLDHHGLARRDGGPRRVRWLTSGDTASMETIGSRLWGAPIRAEPLIGLSPMLNTTTETS